MRSIRRLRGLQTKVIADRMGMPLRSYEYFDSGRGGVTYDRLLSFAQATDSDPLALLVASALNSPELAERSANNKIVLIWMFVLRDLNEELGDDIVYLRPGHIISVLGEVRKKLVEYVRSSDAEAWLSAKMEDLDRRD